MYSLVLMAALASGTATAEQCFGGDVDVRVNFAYGTEFNSHPVPFLPPAPFCGPGGCGPTGCCPPPGLLRPRTAPRGDPRAPPGPPGGLHRLDGRHPGTPPHPVTG